MRPASTAIVAGTAPLLRTANQKQLAFFRSAHSSRAHALIDVLAPQDRWADFQTPELKTVSAKPESVV
jgi:hypothetical protein